MGHAVQHHKVLHLEPGMVPIFIFLCSLNNILKKVSTNPYLGINFSDNLKWTHHINTITKKTNFLLGFLSQNLRHCSTACKQSNWESSKTSS